MNKNALVWLAAAVILIVLGSAVFFGVMIRNHWNFETLDTGNYKNETFTINEKFKNISVSSDTSDIYFYVSDNGRCAVECYMPEDLHPSVSVKGDTLVIEAYNAREWYKHVGINTHTPEIAVYLPESGYSSLLIDESTGDISLPEEFSFENIEITVSTGAVNCSSSSSGQTRLKSSTGDIHADNISAGSLDISVTTGDVTVNSVNCRGDISVSATTGNTKFDDVSCRNITLSSSTGDITLKNVIAENIMTAKSSTGDIRFDKSDASELYIRTTTGIVKGILLSEKVFIIDTSTGDVDVPKSVTGGRCEIKTSTGDINIEVK